MPVSPVNVARVSHNLRSFNLLNTLQANQTGMFRVQNQLSTGLRFLSPSEDPLRAATAGVLDRRMDLINSVNGHLQTANATLRDGEAAMQEGVDMLREAHNIALQAASDTLSEDERQSLATVIDAIIDSAISVGNREHLGRYLFSGHRAAVPPFELGADGVIFRGDAGRSMVIGDTDLSEHDFTISGMEFFGAVSTEIRGIRDLDPAVRNSTRIGDLRGTTGDGVRLSRIAVTDGTTRTEIDLSGAATLGDVLDRLNAEMPDTLQATTDGRGILVQPTAGAGPVSITIEDIGGGQAARDLGLLADSATLAAGGADLDPVLTLQAALADLSGGFGVNLAGGLTIRSGNESAVIDFGAAQTVEDVINAINVALPGVWARIAEDGRTLEIMNRVSGADLYIEENGGSAATNLGVRSLRGDTLLGDLRDGRGVETVEGNDLRIVTADGSAVELDVDGLDTIQDVIDALNAAGGGAITASLATSGNGIVIVDNTPGAGPVRIERVNHSPAIDGLGLNVAATGNALIGADVRPVKVDGAFTALLELKKGLEEDDGQMISAAGARLERALRGMQEVQGRLASMARSMEDRAARVDNELYAARVLSSDVRDVDVSEAVVRFQQLQTALEANLSTSSRILNLSLLDYLR